MRLKLGLAAILVLSAGACTEPARVAPAPSAAPRVTPSAAGPKNQLT